MYFGVNDDGAKLYQRIAGEFNISVQWAISNGKVIDRSIELCSLEESSTIYVIALTVIERSEFVEVDQHVINIKRGAKNAEIVIPKSDAVTKYELTVFVLPDSGDIGTCECDYTVKNQIFTMIEHPTNMYLLDEVKFRTIVENLSDDTFKNVLLKFVPSEHLRLDEKSNERTINTILPHSTVSVSWLCTSFKVGKADVDLTLTTDTFIEKNKLEKDLKIMPIGEPDITRKCRLLGGSENTFTNSFSLSGKEQFAFINLSLYYNSGSALIDGADRLAKYPYGCCEQTYCSTYPNLVLYDYLLKRKTLSSEKKIKLTQNMVAGRDRFISLYFDEKTGGVGLWDKKKTSVFHTSLVLGLFAQLQQYIDVDNDVISKMVSYLVKKQNKDGSFGVSHQVYFGDIPFPALLSIPATTAFVFQNLSFCPKDVLGNLVNLEVITKWFDDNQKDYIEDVTVVSILLDSLNRIESKNTSLKDTMKNSIIKKQSKDGSWSCSKSSSLTQRKGDTGSIENTSYCIVALGGYGYESDINIRNSMMNGLQFLLDSRTTNGYHSTRDTLFAVLALIEYGNLVFQKVESFGDVEVDINGVKRFNISISKDMSDIERIDSVYRLRDIYVPYRFLNARGDNKITVNSEGEANFQLLYEQHVYPECVNIKKEEEFGVVDLQFSKNKIKKDEDVELTVTFHSKMDLVQAVMLEIPLISGFIVSKILSLSKDIDYHVQKEDKICFFSSLLKKDQNVEIKLEMNSEFVGKFQQNCAKAFPMYNPEVQAVSNVYDFVVV